MVPVQFVMLDTSILRMTERKWKEMPGPETRVKILKAQRQLPCLILLISPSKALLTCFEVEMCFASIFGRFNAYLRHYPNVA